MPKREYDRDRKPAIEELRDGAFEYVLTAGMLDTCRQAVDDRAARCPTISARHVTRVHGNAFRSMGHSANTRTMMECFAPRQVGSTLRVAGRCEWRGRRYIVTEAECTGQDGRLIERQSSIHMLQPDEVGRKWG